MTMLRWSGRLALAATMLTVVPTVGFGAYQAIVAGDSLLHVGTVEAAIAGFEARLASDVEADAVGGLTAAIAERGQVIWAKAFGWADTRHRVRADVKTIYRTGSISKTFTATVLMQLVDRGVVALDDRVVRYLPEFAQLDGVPEQVSEITLRELASHTGGLVREPELENAATGPIEQWETKVLASIPTTALASAPGEQYAYSNIGFGILGLALSRAARKPFMDLVTDMIFRPLGMEHSTFIVTADLEPHLAVGYANRRDGTVDEELPAMEHAGRGYKVPNGGVYSTVEDLARFVGGLIGSSDVDIISAASRREMQMVQTPGDSATGYGLGLMLRSTVDGRRLASHSGSVAGYTAFMVFDRATGLSVTLLRNYNVGRTNLRKVATALEEDLVKAAGR
ncbi:MAG: serine hydrolase domain-containing protein [Gemmatimonadales bacterium]